MWSAQFKAGYLGVDIFFVLSGYLMLMLMSRKDHHGLNTISDFYFRRLKRILPTYLLVINGVLMSVLAFASVFDYPFILREIQPAALFYSNDPKSHLLSYFDEDSKFTLFLHTWSLSTEMQFYVLFPLFFVFIYISSTINSKLKFVFVGLIILWSLGKQTLTDEPDSKHMLLICRLWQFFFGFVAHFIYESEAIKARLQIEFKGNDIWSVL
jgi:peptidoglycan/LPS O-acetylase OafA/YrhL